MIINQIAIGRPTTTVAACMSTFQGQIPAGSTIKVQTTDPYPKDFPTMPIRRKSDYIRLKMASADPNSAWVDWDVRLRKDASWPVIPADGKARWYCEQKASFSSVLVCQPCVILWNGDAVLINDLLREFMRTRQEIQALLPQFGNRIVPLPTPSPFIHLWSHLHGSNIGTVHLPGGVHYRRHQITVEGE
jgi:hypothetical protein